MILEIDTWRAAALMLKRYGRQGGKCRAADELASAGDDGGAVTWRRIMAAVARLDDKNPVRLGPLTGWFRHVIIEIGEEVFFEVMMTRHRVPLAGKRLYGLSPVKSEANRGIRRGC